MSVWAVCDEVNEHMASKQSLRDICNMPKQDAVNWPVSQILDIVIIEIYDIQLATVTDPADA